MSHVTRFTLLQEFPDYIVDIDGNVVNKKSGKPVKGSRNPAGYHNYRLKTSSGFTLTIGRHRLLAMAFIPKPSDSYTLVVNHLNGVKGDDRVENLEWTTYAGNLKHAGAMGISPKCLPVTIRNVWTGEVTDFASYKDCGEFLDLSKDAVSLRVTKGPGFVSPEGFQFRSGLLDGDWPFIENIDASMSVFGKSLSLLTLDIETGMELKFETLTKLSEWLECSAASVSTRLRKEEQPLFKNRFLVKQFGNEEPWRTVKSVMEENAELRGLRPVEVTESSTGRKSVFESCRAAAKALGISATTLNYRLKVSQGKTLRDGHSYRYLESSVRHTR